MLARLASEYNSVAIALTETHLSSDIEDNEISIEGWSSFGGDRIGRKCGGTIVYVKEGIPVSNEVSFSNGYCDISAVYLSNKNTAIVSMYRPPMCPTHKFLEAMVFIDKWLVAIYESYDSPIMYMTGDFNLNW